MSLFSFLLGGEEDIMASSHPLARTSSNFPGTVFFQGFGEYKPDEQADEDGVNGIKLERKPSLDLFEGTGSARTGELLVDFISIGCGLTC